MMYYTNETGGFKDKHAYKLPIIIENALFIQK